MMNCSQAPTLILLGLSSDAEKWQPLFSIFLVIYLLGLLGNLLLLLAIGTDVHLHTPMYFFLGNLAVFDIFFPSVNSPKMMDYLVRQGRTISYQGCASQIFLLSHPGLY